jgi:hypothetical protein
MLSPTKLTMTKPSFRKFSATLLSGLAAAALVLIPAPGHAKDLQQVDGQLWQTQSEIVKQAYLVGINNLIDAEYAYQKKFASPKPSSKQTLIQRMYESGDGETIDSVVEAVDAWYAAHPKELKKAVLDVLWLTYVKKES